MMVPTKGTDMGLLSINVFSLNLWICLLCSLCFYIVLVWTLEKNKEGHDEDFDKTKLKQFAASVWLPCNSIFLKIDEGVASFHTKIVLLLWFLLAQVLLKSFTASLSSILVTEKLYPEDDNLKIGNSAGSFVYEYLVSNLNYNPNILLNVTPMQIPAAMKDGSITAAYLELPYLRVLLSEHPKYSTYGESATLGGFGFVFSKDSPLRGDFSTAILKLQENGTIMQLQRKWFNVSLSFSQSSKRHTTQSSLGLANFVYLFIFTTFFAVITALHKYFSTLYPAIQAV